MENNKNQNRPRFPILTVIRKYIKTSQKGSNHWAICPFHQDKSPSLSISEDKNLFKCFACNVSGDAVGFVMRIEKCGYVNAVKKIGELLDLDVSSYLRTKDNKLYALYKLNENVADWYHKYLLSNKEDSKKALEYLTKDRKLTLDTLKKYKIGYAPEEDILEPILNIFKQQNRVTEETISESNLFITTQTNKKFAFFKNRIIFPISNAENNVVGFSGRGDDPKYLNLRNNISFSKNKALFNIENLEENKPIYLFEGFIDLMKTYQTFNCSNGIACMGGIIDSITFPILKKYTNTIILCLDNDSAGINFTINTAKNLINYGFEVLVVNLLKRKEKDIDEMIDADPKKTKKSIDNPIDFLEWYYLNKSPETLDETRLLVKEALAFFLNQNKSLKASVSLTYAKKLINTVFDWYKLTEEYKSSDLAGIVNRNKKLYLSEIEKSAISETSYEVPEIIQKTENDEYRELDKFLKIAIQFQELVEYLHGPSFKQKKKEKRVYRWEYELDTDLKLKIPELEWIFLELESNRKAVSEKPELLKKYLSKAKKIRSEEEFFSLYYSFYIHYLNELFEFYKSDAMLDSYSKVEKTLRIQDELKKIDEISWRTLNFFVVKPYLKN